MRYPKLLLRRVAIPALGALIIISVCFFAVRDALETPIPAPIDNRQGAGSASQLSIDPVSPFYDTDWNSVVIDKINCSYAGDAVQVGVKSILTDQDVNSDGLKDAIVEYSCETNTSSAFSQVEAFDGSSDIQSPRSLGVILFDPYNNDPVESAYENGVLVDSITITNGTVTLNGHMFRTNDPSACPSLIVKQRARWVAPNFRVEPIERIGDDRDC